MFPQNKTPNTRAACLFHRLTWPIGAVLIAFLLSACNQELTRNKGLESPPYSPSTPVGSGDKAPTGEELKEYDEPLAEEYTGEEIIHKTMRGMEVHMDAMPSSAHGTYTDGGEMGSTALGRAGTLTAGEVNDLSKFELWEGISQTALAAYATTWQVHLGQRYAVVIRNGDNGVVVGAKVQLVTPSGSILWQSVTNNSGRVELFDCLDSGQTHLSRDLKLLIEYGDKGYQAHAPAPYAQGINQLIIPVDCDKPTAVDIAFVVDATGSMGDEINYLKAELLDVIEEVNQAHKDVDMHTAAVFYRDLSDAYVTRASDFSNDPNKTLGFVKEQYADGGGDMPEAVDSALSVALNTLTWRNPARAKLLFLVLDAPPHSDPKAIHTLRAAMHRAAQQGIRIIPVVCSGSDKSNEFLMRSLAVGTGGTYLFLTDHSGIGGTHITPTTDSFDVRYLNDLMKETIDRYLDVITCANDQPATPRHPKEPLHHVVADPTLVNPGNARDLQVITLQVSPILAKADPLLPYHNPNTDMHSMQVYPNPSKGLVNVAVDFEHGNCNLLDGTGQLLRQFQVSGTQYSLDLSTYASGIYYLRVTDEKGKPHTARLVLQHGT
ncbi:MAG: T9SS type A sorting domain-containing protein [Bacteroidetes bacterium]|nr:T9SS type A sorting domain-containing protein [Bacteroidota bacterium]